MKDKLARLSIINLMIINLMSVSVNKIAAENRYRRQKKQKNIRFSKQTITFLTFSSTRQTLFLTRSKFESKLLKIKKCKRRKFDNNNYENNSDYSYK